MRRDARINYFVTTALEGRYADTAGEEGLPLYLQYDGQEALRRLGSRERLKLHIGSIFEQAKALAPKVGGFDLISISNVADWMDEPQLAAVVADMQACLNPGGALLARTVRDGRMIAEAMGRHLAVDDAFNAQLAEIERGPWFRTISAGFRPQANAPSDGQG
jgi:S-adenosylmethionine:diacylglycerol 3-amino-3-carboxypropyl transferase